MKPATRVLFVTLILAAAGLGVYALREQSRQAAQRRALDEKIASARTALDRTLHEREITERELAALARASNDTGTAAVASRVAAPPPNPAVTAWEQKVATLRSLLARHPEWAIPEIGLLSPDEFIFFARAAQLDGEEAQRKALRDLRALAKRKLAMQFHDVLDEYALSHGGQLPADLHELTDLFKPPVPDAVLERYVLTGMAAVPAGQEEAPLLYEQTPVDELYDTRHVLGVRMSIQYLTNPEVYVFARAVAAYSDANAGHKPIQPSELGPYLEAPFDALTLSRYFSGWQTNPACFGAPAGPTTMHRTANVTTFRPIGGPR